MTLSAMYVATNQSTRTVNGRVMKLRNARCAIGSAHGSASSLRRRTRDRARREDRRRAELARMRIEVTGFSEAAGANCSARSLVAGIIVGTIAHFASIG